MSTTTLKHQIFFYLLCGAITTSLDFLIYTSLYKVNVEFDLAKGVSFLIATLVSYFLNKHITFKTQNRSWIEFVNFVVAHIAAMLVDVTTNHLFVFLLGVFLIGHAKMTMAFALATGCSVIVNFLAQRYWVFSRAIPDHVVERVS